MSAVHKLTLVDLFAGCGGLSFGLELAGFHPIYVNELNRHALETYLTNREEVAPLLKQEGFHSHDIRSLVRNEGEVRNLSKRFKHVYGLSIPDGDLDLLVGGPPCQGYSGIGHRRSYAVEKAAVSSNHLYRDMARLIAKLTPKVFLFENVRGLLNAKWTASGRNGEIWADVQHEFHSIPGYRVQSELIYAKNYGVAQNRPRVMLVGVRDDVSLRPWEDLRSGVAGGFLPPATLNAPNLIDVLGDLVDPEFSSGVGFTRVYPMAAHHPIQRTLRMRRDGTIARKGDCITEHEYSKHRPHVVARFEYMLRHNGAIPEAYRTKKFAQRLLPEQWPESGPSITATSLSDDYVHFSQPRTLTVREWARLQGFPDWYRFSGSRTTGGLRRAGNPRLGLFDRELPKYTQIGNAVPVNLAKEIGQHVALLLRPSNKVKRKQLESCPLALG